MTDDNLAIAHLRRAFAALRARDWQALAETHADGNVYEDRRRGLMTGVLNKEENLMRLRATADLGVDSIEFDVLDAPEDHVVLYRTTLRSSQTEFAIHSLVVTQVDDLGRAIRGIQFDPDDFAAARAALDEMAAQAQA